MKNQEFADKIINKVKGMEDETLEKLYYFLTAIVDTIEVEQKIRQMKKRT